MGVCRSAAKAGCRKVNSESIKSFKIKDPKSWPLSLLAILGIGFEHHFAEQWVYQVLLRRAEASARKCFPGETELQIEFSTRFVSKIWLNWKETIEVWKGRYYKNQATGMDVALIALPLLGQCKPALAQAADPHLFWSHIYIPHYLASNRFLELNAYWVQQDIERERIRWRGSVKLCTFDDFLQLDPQLSHRHRGNERQGMIDELWEALETLTEEDRALVEARFFSNIQVQDLAELYQVSVKTIYNRTQKVLDKLRGILFMGYFISKQ